MHSSSLKKIGAHSFIPSNKPPGGGLSNNLHQRCPTRGRRVVEGFVQPRKISILCKQNTMTTCLYFNIPKIDIFDAVAFSACFTRTTHW